MSTGGRYGRWAGVAGLALLLAGCGGASGAGACVPGARECRAGEVWACRADASGFDWVVTCPVGSTTCTDGACLPLGFADAVDAPDVRDDAPADPRDTAVEPPDASPDPGRPDPGPHPESPDVLVDPGAPDPGVPDPASPEPAPEVVEPEPDEVEPAPPDSTDVAGSDRQEPDAADAPPAEPEPDVVPISDTAPDHVEPVEPGCGDGVVQAPEQCEPGKPLGKTCAQLGYASGTPACRADCTFDTGGCDALGALAYEKLANLSFLDDFVDVAWRADGVEAWFVRSNGGLVHYDPDTKLLAEVSLPAGLLVRRVVPIPFEPAVLLAGAIASPSTSARLYRYAPDDASFTELEAFRADGYEWVAGRFAPDGKQFVAGGRKPTTQGSLVRWSAVPFAGDTRQQVMPAWPNLTDVLWADGAGYGQPYVKTVEGVNGTGSHDWIVSTDVLLDTSPAGFGNFGRGEWRPGGDCAVFGAWSTQNKVYLFHAGAWSYLSFSAPYFSAQSTAWNAAGTRLLVVGDAGGGADLVGSVHEFRPNGADCGTGTWVSQVIPDFDAEPWLGKGDTWFHHAAWRPHANCAEGLIAAADNGLSYSPTFGLAIRFHDSADPACE